MTETADARRYPRFAVEIDAQVCVGGETMAAITKDMSRGGICMVCPKPLDAGADLTFALALTLGAGTFSESLKLNGRVVWCTRLGHAYQVGAVFTDLGHEETAYLEMFLRFLQQEVLVAGSEPPASQDGQFDLGDADKP